jgi:hypothetical protein
MNRGIKYTAVCALLLALALSQADAGAQFPGGGGMGGMGRGTGGPKGGREPRPDVVPIVRRHLPDEVDERLYRLEEDLRLSPEQQPSWARYADTVRQTAQDIERDRSRNDLRESLPVPERLDRIVETSRNRLTALEDVAASAKALYQVLSPPQRQIGDSRFTAITALLVDVAPQAGRGPGASPGSRN